MTRTKKLLIRYILPLITIILLLALLAVALFRLSVIQREMRYNSNANMVWVVYYTHLESLRLSDVIQKKALNPDANVDLLFRYQMLLSRLNLLHDGPQSRFFDEVGLLAELNTQSVMLRQLEPLLGASPLNQAQLKDLQHALDEFSAFMLKASGRAMTAQWEELGAGVDMNRNAVLAIIVIIIAILFCSLFISWQLLIALKRSRENERVKQQQLELQKQLEHERKVSELYRSFGGMVSHQFRTPLAIIDASMQRLIRAAERMTPAQVVDRAVKVKAATERLTHLIESILKADRLLEQVDMQLQRFSLADLVRQVIDEQAFLSVNRQVSFSAQSGKDLQALCDPVLVSEIIGNFLSNADKYSSADTAIAVYIYQEDRWVCCQVQDQGRGISKADLPHIFQRYFRAGSVADVAGTGIGLYVAAELAALQRGKVTVRSDENSGSIFTLCLPHHFNK
ncbi:sensor histidine kinase [Denitrificimonas caeni]|uniref:sensor histidine kinase n=1 Tax=Denitrificimonas caeni TaxID=521720 RepID=UPI0019639BAA|nr:HAMP domain-containing sensor histidine kinase [Denitrificimonas caeni]